MGKKQLKIISIDSSILLAIFNKENNRYWPSRMILEEAKKGKYIIIISSLSIFEVSERFAIEGKLDKMPQFWNWEGIVAVNVNTRISLEAIRIKTQCNLRRNQKVDAILIATAVVMEAEFFYTWDNKLIKKLSKCPYIYGTKLRITNPPRALF